MKKSQKNLLYAALWALIFPMSAALANEEPQILFVCGGNTGRSPLAESLANHYFDFPQAGYTTFSRGLNVNPQERTPEKNALTVMRQWGNATAMEKHLATPITMADIHAASLVLTMTKVQKEKLLALDPTAVNKVFTLSQCANGSTQDVNDMYGHDLAFYQQTAKKIASYLQLIKAHGFVCQNTDGHPGFIGQLGNG